MSLTCLTTPTTVTAGVLRGDRARFQLFGDTVNTTVSLEPMLQH